MFEGWGSNDLFDGEILISSKKKVYFIGLIAANILDVCSVTVVKVQK